MGADHAKLRDTTAQIDGADGRTSPTQGCGHCHMSVYPGESMDKDNHAHRINRNGDVGPERPTIIEISLEIYHNRENVK